MANSEVTFRLEAPADCRAIKKLYSDVLGPGRFTRTAYRLRRGTPPIPSLCFTAWHKDQIIGSIRFTALTIDGKSGALLLGPLVISPSFAGRGYGLKLVAEGLKKSRELRYHLVILVGDLPYYERAGFSRIPAERIKLPGPVDPLRLLGCELVPGALNDYVGFARAEMPPDKK